MSAVASLEYIVKISVDYFVDWRDIFYNLLQAVLAFKPLSVYKCLQQTMQHAIQHSQLSKTGK